MLKQRIVYLFSISVILLALIFDAWQLWTYALDIPFWDEWDMMPAGNFSNIFRFYNKNMQLFYELISEIMYRYFDWNLRYFSFINFLIYLCIVVIYYKLVSIAAKTADIKIYPMLVLPLLTPMLGHNWLWALLIQTHTYILFFLLGIYFGFVKDENKYTPITFSLCMILSVLSMNIPLAIGGILAYIIKEIVNSKPKDYKKIIIKGIIPTGSFIVVLLWRLAHDLPPEWAMNRVSASYYLDTISSLNYINNVAFYIAHSQWLFAFADKGSFSINLFLFATYIIMLMIVFFEQYRIKQRQPLFGILFGILFSVCSVITIRRSEVYNYFAGFIRHNETAFMLIPASLFVFIVSKYKVIRIYGYFMFALMVFGYIQDVRSDRFAFFGKLYYRNACLCINHYYNLKTISNWQCEMNYPVMVDEKIAYAQKMNLHFLQTIPTCVE